MKERRNDQNLKRTKKQLHTVTKGRNLTLKEHLLPFITASLAAGANCDHDTAAQAIRSAEQRYGTDVVKQHGSTVTVDLGLLLRAERIIKPIQPGTFRCASFDQIPLQAKAQGAASVRAQFPLGMVNWYSSWHIHDLMIQERDHLTHRDPTPEP